MLISAGKRCRGILYSKVFVRKAKELLITAVALSFWPKWESAAFSCTAKHQTLCFHNKREHPCASATRQSLCPRTELLLLLSPRGKCQPCWQWWWCPLLLTAPVHPAVCPAPGLQAHMLSIIRDKCHQNCLAPGDTGTPAPAQPEPCSQVVPSVELAHSIDLCLLLNTDSFVLLLSSYDLSCVFCLLSPQRKKFSHAWFMC